MTDKLFISPQQIVSCGKYPFTLGQIRHLLLHRHTNGLKKAVLKIGKRLIFKQKEFEEWIESHRER